MSLFTDTFPLMFYINLDSRPDRKELAQKEFEKLGLNPMRKSGVVVTGYANSYLNGTMGCFKSHLDVLEYAENMSQNVFIFEDDVKFTDIENLKEVLDKTVEELNGREWDMFYLSANILLPFHQVSPHLAKLRHGQSTVAYGVNSKFISKLWGYFFVGGLLRRPWIDVVYADHVIPENNCFISVPMLATQRNGFSDIEGTEVEYEGYLQARYNNYFHGNE